MAFRILITDVVHESLVEILSRKYMVFYRPGIERNRLEEEIEDKDVLIVRSRTRLNREVLQRAKNLKLIIRAGIGLDNIDCEFARERGIEVRNTKNASINSVSELVIGFMIALSRNILPLSNSTRSGKWDKDKFIGFELKGKNLGIIGTGNIGRSVALMARFLGMNVFGFDPFNKDVSFIKYISFDEILSISHFISIHVPLTEETYHLINKKAVDKMRRGVFLINTSRGEVVDEEALVCGLKSGKISGCALDVFETEPPEESKLFEFDNCIFTPHIGGNTEEAKMKIKDEIIEILKEFEVVFPHGV